MVISVSIKGYGKKPKKFISELGVYAKNVNNYTYKSTLKQSLEITSLMINKIRIFAHDGELERGLGVKPKLNGSDGHTVNIHSTAPHSGVNEFGVEPHWVPYDDKPGFQKWVDDKYIGDADVINPGYIFVGGAGSRIKLGNSRNKFFRNSIEEYLRGNRSQSQYIKALRQATADTFR